MVNFVFLSRTMLGIKAGMRTPSIKCTTLLITLTTGLLNNKTGEYNVSII